MLRSEAEQLRREPDYYVLHDHLEEFNEALFFHQFAARAACHGLAFLAEAEFRMMQIDGLPVPVAHTLNRMAPGILEREQLTDFLRNRTFRQTLLVREGRSNRSRLGTGARERAVGRVGSTRARRRQRSAFAGGG